MNKRIASELNRVARAICTNRVVISAKDFSPQIAYVKNVFRKKNCTVDFEVETDNNGKESVWITIDTPFTSFGSSITIHGFIGKHGNVIWTSEGLHHFKDIKEAVAIILDYPSRTGSYMSFLLDAPQKVEQKLKKYGVTATRIKKSGDFYLQVESLDGRIFIIDIDDNFYWNYKEFDGNSVLYTSKKFADFDELLHDLSSGL
ncbi:MAG: hypothetical protein PHV07_08300 [Oscillospiraceae bacterium]|nr:hypothetical protein [Oscillospiraceae bacterium]